MQYNDKMGSLIQSYVDSRAKNSHEWLANEHKYLLKEVFPDCDPAHYANDLIALIHRIKTSANKCWPKT